MSIIEKTKLFFAPLSRLKIVVLLLFSLGVAVLEISGIAVIVPFIGMLDNPSIIHTNHYLNYIYLLLGCQTDKSFMIYLGLIIIAIWVLRNFIMLYFNYLKFQYSHHIKYFFGKSLFESYLTRDYLFHLEQESSVLLRNTQELLAHLIQGFMLPILQFVTDILVVIIILMTLFIIDWELTFVLFAFFGVMILAVYFYLKGELSALGDHRNDLTVKLYKYVSRGLQGIKDVKILGKEHFFYNQFSDAFIKRVRVEIKFDVISVSPILLFELVGMTGLILLMIYMIITGREYQSIISVVTLYAIAAYRLLPRSHTISLALSNLRYYRNSIDIVANELTDMSGRERVKLTDAESNEKIQFIKRIKIDHLSFKYPASKELVLNNISLVINKNQSHAFVGSSGAGKTTLVDIIMSFFSYDSGEIYIDDTLLTKDNQRLWRKNIGYIPQQIFLYDDTIAVNIAFGVAEHEIDQDRLKQTIKIAQLEQVIEHMPYGLETLIGENGVKISGGQRQRIGIARALYHDPDLLIMDEATSALDNLTETEIVDEITQLSRVKTLIVIAHRITTIEHCDLIHVLDNGRIIASGKYDELIQTCELFRKLARVDTSS